MLDIEYHNMFRKDYKKYLKNGFDSKLLDESGLRIKTTKTTSSKTQRPHIKRRVVSL